MLHSAPARHAAHIPAILFAGWMIENELLFELYTTAGVWPSAGQYKTPAAMPKPGPAGRLPPGPAATPKRVCR